MQQKKKQRPQGRRGKKSEAIYFGREEDDAVQPGLFPDINLAEEAESAASVSSFRKSEQEFGSGK